MRCFEGHSYERVLPGKKKWSMDVIQDKISLNLQISYFFFKLLKALSWIFFCSTSMAGLDKSFNILSSFFERFPRTGGKLYPENSRQNVPWFGLSLAASSTWWSHGS